MCCIPGAYRTHADSAFPRRGTHRDTAPLGISQKGPWNPWLCDVPRSKQESNYEETNIDGGAWRRRYARHSHHFIRAKRSSDRRLPVGGGRRERQSRLYDCPDAQWKDRATANHENPRPQSDLGADGNVLRCLSRQLLTADVPRTIPVQK